MNNKLCLARKYANSFRESLWATNVEHPGTALYGLYRDFAWIVEDENACKAVWGVHVSKFRVTRLASSALSWDFQNQEWSKDN